ncbi:uncharacterized protein LOC116775757 [Danaus plexippus]|uniref:uncharacterized protein LOC116775757 n=1 Tax=Danaus plexippus TaxID=13037 RepID=UPI002AAF389E|nr:uncharacterized protein LOC116775757 [Danaus plexippus]
MQTDYERSNKSVIIGDVDVDIILKDSSHKARENQEIKSRKINFIGDNDNEMTEKNQRRKQKHLMIIVTNNKEVHEDMLDSESLYLDPEKDLTEGDFEKDSLRRKYGKACIKVAVRKCYKTIHSVRNIVCKTRYSCKSSFKSTFLFEAKRSCIIEFDPTTNLIKKQRKLETNNRVRKSKRDTALYITQCMPQLVKEYIRTVPSRLKKPSGTKSILRGRSTRKCHKLLRGKCYNACMYSLRQTCSNVDCSKHFQKIFKKECKRECARQYLIIRDSSDSSVSKISDDSD